MNWDAQGLFNGLTALEDRMERAVEAYGQAAGQKLEAHAKENAPWQDRTGIARQTITGGGEWEGDKMRVYVSGNVSYFQYLEFAHEKRYAILNPTVHALESEIVQGMANLLNQ